MAAYQATGVVAARLVCALLTTCDRVIMQSTQSTSSQCARCIFKMAGKQVCVAFPRGIPADIITGRFDHMRPHDGDGGIRFVALRQRTSERQPAFSEDR